MFTTIHETLSTIHSSLKTQSSLSKDDWNILAKLCENQVPLKWRKVWSGPKSIGEYLKGVATRISGAMSRYANGLKDDEEFGTEIELTQVFSVESFFSALKLANSK